MRAHFLSDLHRNLWDVPVPVRFRSDVDVVILAGDTAEGIDGVVWASRERDRHAPGVEVVYLLGNHESYHLDILQTRQDIQEAGRRLGITVLDPGVHQVKGIRLLGCTLWSDFRTQWREPSQDPRSPHDRQKLGMSKAREGSTYLRTRRGERFLLPEDTLVQHEAEKAWLEEQLEDATPTLVITHHGPVPYSIHPKFDGNDWNGCFVSDLRPMIDRVGPLAWVHGHVHNRIDILQGRTRILCNPLGVSSTENPEWDPGYVLTVTPDGVLALPRSS